MEELNLKKAIKELKKQIKEQEEKVFNASKKLDEQKEKDEREKQFKYGEIDCKIDMAHDKAEKARKINKVMAPISAGFFVSMLFLPVFLGLSFPNLVWLPFTVLGLSIISFIPTFTIYSKTIKEIEKQKNIIKDACNKKDRIILEKSEKLHVLEMDMDIEYNILRDLNNDYRTLTKYANKKEPEKIAKGKIEVRKAKSFKEKVDKIIEEDTNLLNK